MGISLEEALSRLFKGRSELEEKISDIEKILNNDLTFEIGDGDCDRDGMDFASVSEWCFDNNILFKVNFHNFHVPTGGVVETYTITFKNEKDAVAFKLRWL